MLLRHLFSLRHGKRRQLYCRFTTVFFDEADNEVGGISETYLTYDIAYYYDAGADGLLSYINPTQIIDGDFGEGIDDIYFDLICGTMYGIEVSYTTNNYQRNRVVCADTVHYVRSVFVPTPFAGPYYDPYRLSQIEPKRKENGISLMIPENPSEFYSTGEVTIVGYSYACIRTPTVASVEFQTINSDVTTDNPATLGGGQRVFPDRQTPNDGVNRRIVRVRAQLASSGGSPTFTSGARVYFRNFDVDDPSTDPIIDPMGNLGNDNRGIPLAGSLNLPSATTDSNGIATVEFTTTMQPGDNFVIAASTDQNYLNGNGVVVNGTGLQDSTGNQLPTSRAQRTQMLSVWRKVYLEVDSMGPVGNNLSAGRIRDRGTIGATPVWLNLYPTTGFGSLEPGRFQGGEMTSGTYRFEVLDNTSTQVQIRSNNGNAFLPYNSIFQLFDDDDFNDSDGPPPGDSTLDGDDGEDVTFRGSTMFTETFSRLQPSSDINQNPYAAAYIEPDYVWAENQPGMNDSNVQFEIVTFTPPNFLNERRVVNAQRDSAGLANEEFWIGYLLIGYEANVANDDPELNALGGVAPPIDVATAWTNSVTDSRDVTRGSIGAVFYIEVMRDWDVTPGRDFRIRTAPHELGHQFGLLGDNSDPSPLPDWGLMSPSSQNLYFVPTHLNILRWRPSSPGEL